jgi:hypothetical protein
MVAAGLVRPWVKALAAAGCRVYAVNPKQASRHRETVANSGKKDDFFDAGCLADLGWTRLHQMREIAADSDIAEAVEIAARAPEARVGAHQAPAADAVGAAGVLPAALEAYRDLTWAGSGALELLQKAPDPESAAKLTVTKITAALKRAGG